MRTITVSLQKYALNCLARWFRGGTSVCGTGRLLTSDRSIIPPGRGFAIREAEILEAQPSTVGHRHPILAPSSVRRVETRYLSTSMGRRFTGAARKHCGQSAVSNGPGQRRHGRRHPNLEISQLGHTR